MAKGSGWTVSERPLVVGRESTCDVRILNTVVSRKHCEIFMDGEVLRLKHLGSINPTLVNGLSALECKLEIGDEIRVGPASFLVVSAETKDPRAAATELLSADTLAEEDSVYLSAQPEHAASEVHPKTDADLTELFQISRALSRVTSHEGLIAALRGFLRARFAPDAAWLLFLQDPSVPDGQVVNVLSPGSSVKEAAARGIRARLSKVLTERRGLLFPERAMNGEKVRVCCTMAAPIFFGEHHIGALCIERTLSERVWYRQDLHFFVALAHIIAPFFGAIERMEQLEAENRKLRATGEKLGRIVGGSKSMAQVQRVVTMVAPSMQPVLILGPTGTGKELIAGLIHELSSRAKEPMVTVNCAAIPRELFESEFFGHEKGAFTGAVGRKTGLLEQSHKGTLFLDEIGDLSLEHQARILRAVETGRFRRVGGEEEISADFRVVTATNKELVEEIKAGRFREDLYHRLRAVEIRIAPLCQRRCDIPELAQYFLEAAAAKSGAAVRRLNPKALEYLAEMPWPGNVRELKNVMEVAHTICQDGVIDVADLRAFASVHDRGDTPATLSDVERKHIARTLEYTNGNMVETARLLGIGRSTLYNKIAHYELKD
jgi:DNA-binding NtrC family response regulator